MQQIIGFIIKNSNKLLFFLLLGISLVLTIQYHSFHRSKLVNSANSVTGYIYLKRDQVTDYFDLKNQNERLMLENTQLRKMLFNNDSLADIPKVNSLFGRNNILVIPSKVIKNSYNNLEQNFLTIKGGSAKGIKPDMGVVNENGVVGIIEYTSKNYATVFSILNTKFEINAKIKKTNHPGTITWNGKNTAFVQLVDVPRSVAIREGDSVVTGYSRQAFPENTPIGKVHKIYIDKETNLYTLDVKLFNDMTNLNYVYITENTDKKEIEALEKKTENKE